LHVAVDRPTANSNGLVQRVFVNAEEARSLLR
jgi:hypothetical protein